MRLICVTLLVFQMQQQELAQIRQREANLTALAAIGPRKKRKMDSPVRGASAEVRNNGAICRTRLVLVLNCFTFAKKGSVIDGIVFAHPRAQGQARPSLEAPAEQAPDSLCDSASPESTSGICSSAWRMKEGPVTHTCSIKASSNSTRIKVTSLARWH